MSDSADQEVIPGAGNNGGQLQVLEIQAATAAIDLDDANARLAEYTAVIQDGGVVSPLEFSRIEGEQKIAAIRAKYLNETIGSLKNSVDQAKREAVRIAALGALEVRIRALDADGVDTLGRIAEAAAQTYADALSQQERDFREICRDAQALGLERLSPGTEGDGLAGPWATSDSGSHPAGNTTGIRIGAAVYRQDVNALRLFKERVRFVSAKRP